MVRKIPGKKIGICWDMGHSYSNVVNHKFPLFPPKEFLERVIHTHIHDPGPTGQRGITKITVESMKFIWVEELIQVAEDSSSSPVYTLLKRVDEKFVTEHAYDNPRFVEDSAQEVAVRLRDDERIKRFQVEVENFESIHNHSAYACVTG